MTYFYREEVLVPASIQVILIITFLSYLGTLLLLINQCNYSFILFNFSLISTNFILSTKIIILILALSIILIAIPSLLSQPTWEIYILFSFALLGSLLLVSSNDFFIFYLALELQSYSLYILVALKRKSLLAAEIGLKYFFQGSFVSGLTLVGISFLYGITGTFNFNDLALIITPDLLLSLPALSLGISLLLGSFFFKLTIVPFHSWAAETYAGTFSYVAAFIILIPKTVFVSLLFRITPQFLWSWFETFPFILDTVNLTSLIIGSLSGIFEQNIMKILAFSGIANISFILSPLRTGDLLGIHSALLYTFVYFLLILNLLSFLFAFVIPSKGLLLRTTYDLRYIFHTNPYLGLSLVLTLFSLAGLPPLAGFFSKAFVLISLIESESYIFPFILLLISAISSFFYLDFIVRLLFQYDFAYAPILQAPVINTVIIYCTSTINILFMLVLPYINFWIIFMISDLTNPWFL